MLSRLVFRNGLHKHDLRKIIKSKIRHFCEAHTYLKLMGCANLFQRIASLFGGNRANGSSVRDKCRCHFSHGRQRSLSMYGQWLVETCPNWHVWGSLCASRTITQRTCWMFSQYCTSHKRLETAPLMGSINALLSCNCTKRSPLTFPAVTCRTFLMRTWEKYGNVPLH